MLLQDTTHLIQRPCYQRGSPCQDPAGNRTTPRPPDHRKVTQTAVVWSRLQFITSGQNHFAIAYSHKSCIMNSFYESDFAEADDSHNNRLLQYFIIPHEFMVYQNPINISWPHSYPSAILHTLWAYTVTQTVSISPNDIAVIYFSYSDPNPRSKRWGCSNRYCIVRHIVRHKLQLRLVSENVPKLLTGPHYTAISTLKWVKISWKPKKNI